MSRGEAWAAHLSTLAVGGSGLVYAWMRHLCRPADEFALVNHPLEPTVQHLHLWAAPLSVFAVGLLWREHVWRRVRSGFAARRTTGLPLFLLFWPMVLSGVWVQLADGELARRLSVWMHALTGLAWGGIYVLHLVTPVARGEGRPDPRR